MVAELKEVDYDFEIADELKQQIQELHATENQIIFHFTMHPLDQEDGVRIWKSTYLVDETTGIHYPLLFAEGVSLAPLWTFVPPNETKYFTLIFKGMPKSVHLFHLIEIIPEDGGFYIGNILRNATDVYYVEM